jgi:pimeloyl-ACP methyl ester carboxylesterase
VVAWHIAEHHPNAFEKLAILNVPHPQVMIQTLRNSLGQLGRSWYIFFFQIPWLPEKLLAWNGYRAMWRMMLSSSKPGSFNEIDREAYLQAWSQPGALTAMLNWYRAAFRQGLKSYSTRGERPAANINIPTLMLWGAQDFALSREMAQPSIDLCQQGELHYFENATHWLQLDEADQVNNLLVEFFNRGQ